MIKINFLFIIKDPSILLEEKRLRNFFALVNLLKEDRITISSNIYYLKIEEKPFYNFLRENKLNREISSLLLSFFDKTSVSDKTEEVFIDDLIKSNLQSAQGLLEIEGDEMILAHPIKCVQTSNGYYELKRFYAKQSDYRNIYVYFKECFPQLIFNERKEGYSLNTYNHVNIDEVFKILTRLNDTGRKIYDDCLHDSAKAIRLLNSNGLTCSGGDAISFCCELNACSHKISCSPHFKIERADSNKRLYFSWGDKKYGEEKVIVCYIGGHLKANKKA